MATKFCHGHIVHRARGLRRSGGHPQRRPLRRGETIGLLETPQGCELLGGHAELLMGAVSGMRLTVATASRLRSHHRNKRLERRIDSGGTPDDPGQLRERLRQAGHPGHRRHAVGPEPHVLLDERHEGLELGERIALQRFQTSH